MSVRGLLIDLDDTLFDHATPERHARRTSFALVASELAVTPEEVSSLYDASRAAVKARLGPRGSAHSRLLYFHELAHRTNRPLLCARTWNEAFWSAYLESAVLRPGASELLFGARRRGLRVAIVTDLVLDVQLRKLDRFGLADAIDALVASEEVPYDKPARGAFMLAAARLGVACSACVVIGDSRLKDGEGARALGIPYYRVHSSDPNEAGGEPAPHTLVEVMHLLRLNDD